MSKLLDLVLSFQVKKKCFCFLSSFPSKKAWLDSTYLSLPPKLHHTWQYYEEIKRAGLFLFRSYLAVERGHHARAFPGNLNVA